MLFSRSQPHNPTQSTEHPNASQTSEVGPAVGISVGGAEGLAVEIMGDADGVEVDGDLVGCLVGDHEFSCMYRLRNGSSHADVGRG